MKNGPKIQLICLMAALMAILGCGKTSSDATQAGPTPPAPSQFLFLSDIHYGSHLTNHNGQYDGDTGPVLWKAAKAKITGVIKEQAPKFVVYTGDLPEHTGSCPLPLTGTCHSEHEGNLAAVLQDLAGLLPKGVPLFYAPGNNDAMAGDYYRFADAEDSIAFQLVNSADHYPTPNANTPCGKAPCILTPPSPHHGYYSAKALDGLRIIALNSVILTSKYASIGQVPKTSAGDSMMTWLHSELADAAQKGDKAYLIMHVPPNQWQSNWRTAFLSELEQHQNTVTGILYGHTHMDEQLVFYGVKQTNVVTEVGISCPGITPLHENNPGFKTVAFDPQSTELIDFTTYWTTPGAINWGDSTYSLQQTYGVSGSPTLFTALRRVGQFNSDSILNQMRAIFWVKNAPSAKAKQFFPATVAVR